MRRLVVLLALLGVAVGAASCTTSPPAATVDGATITQSTLDTQLHVLVTDAAAGCVFVSAFAPPSTSLAGAGQDTVSAAAATAELGDLVVERLIAKDLAAHHRTVTAADVAAARTDLALDVETSLSDESQEGAVPPACAGAPANPVEHAAGGYTAGAARFVALQEQFQALAGHVDLSPVAIDRYYARNQAEFREACLDVVAADTQSAAQSIEAAVAGGESMASAASGPGADTQLTPPGAELGCQPSSVVTGSFGAANAAAIYAAAPGQVLAPFAWTQPQTGTSYWLVMQVVELTEAPLSSVASSIRETLLSGTEAASRLALAGLLRRADVSVDPAYGSWRRDTGLTAPVPPPPADVLDPSADESLALLRS